MQPADAASAGLNGGLCPVPNPVPCCPYRYKGVSKKKGRWEAKVMVNRKWAYRELFDSEEAAARAYDTAGAPKTLFAACVWRRWGSLVPAGLSALLLACLALSSKCLRPCVCVTLLQPAWTLPAQLPSCRKHMQECLPCMLGMALHVWSLPCAVWRLKPKEAASYVNFKDKPGTITNKLAIAAKSMQRAQSRENLAGLREDKGAGPAPTRPPSRRLAGQDPVGEQAVCLFDTQRWCICLQAGILYCGGGSCVVNRLLHGGCGWALLWPGVGSGASAATEEAWACNQAPMQARTHGLVISSKSTCTFDEISLVQVRGRATSLTLVDTDSSCVPLPDPAPGYIPDCPAGSL